MIAAVAFVTRSFTSVSAGSQFVLLVLLKFRLATDDEWVDISGSIAESPLLLIMLWHNISDVDVDRDGVTIMGAIET